MWRRLFCITSIAIGIGHPAASMSDIEALNLATGLGNIIGSEEFCGLHYDQSAIAEFIAKSVPKDRLDFAGLLQSAIMGAGYWQKDMTESAKTAHCTIIAGTATQYGFMK